MDSSFEWDELKNSENQQKHSVSFEEAQDAFADMHRLIAKDKTHSQKEERLYCIGKIKRGIVMVRFTYRGDRIRIFGAGFWRKGRREYEHRQKS